MSKPNTYGQVNDTETITHTTLAARLSRSPDWVLEHLIFPKHAETGEEVDGIPAVRIGDLIFTSGEAFRLYVQSQSKPLRRPRTKGGNLGAKAKKTRRTRRSDAGSGNAAG